MLLLSSMQQTVNELVIGVYVDPDLQGNYFHVALANKPLRHQQSQLHQVVWNRWTGLLDWNFLGSGYSLIQFSNMLHALASCLKVLGVKDHLHI